MRDKRPIGVFDSGVGGLSVLRELQRRMPSENYIFLADQSYVPYGEKNKKQLIERARRITNFLISRYKIKLLVIACNTATCYALKPLRTEFDVPIVGTVPAVKTASEKTRSSSIAVLSTPATAKSPALHALIRRYAKEVNVMRIGCAGLEDAVENGFLTNQNTLQLLKRYLAPVAASSADQIVLGCTHYPFLKKHIRRQIGRSVSIIDSGRAIARHTSNLLKMAGISSDSKHAGYAVYLTTGDANMFSDVASKLLLRHISARHTHL